MATCAGLQDGTSDGSAHVKFLLHRADALDPQAALLQQAAAHSPSQQPAHRAPAKQPGAHRRLQQLASHKGHQVASLLVIAQVLRVLLAVSSCDPASAQFGVPGSRLRAQLLKELRGAAAAARLGGHQKLCGITLLQHLPPARLQQLRAAARKHPCRGGSTPHQAAAYSRSPASSSTSSDSGNAPVLPASLHHHQQPQQAGQRWAVVHPQHQPQQFQPQPQQQPQQQAVVDVGCLLETTLVAAAAEAQLASLSIERPGAASSLEDDASSSIDIEAVMQEELVAATAMHGVV